MTAKNTLYDDIVHGLMARAGGVGRMTYEEMLVIAQSVYARIVGTDRLITDQAVFRVLETDWTDGGTEGQEFTVYTGPDKEEDPS